MKKKWSYTYDLNRTPVKDVYATQSSHKLSTRIHWQVDEVEISSAKMVSGIMDATNVHRRLGKESTTMILKTHFLVLVGSIVFRGLSRGSLCVLYHTSTYNDT